MGYTAWPYIGIVCCFMGFMFSWLSSFGKTSLLLPCGAILYGSAELWRIDLFRQGIFIVWFVAGIGVPAICSSVRQTTPEPKLPRPKSALSATENCLIL